MSNYQNDPATTRVPADRHEATSRRKCRRLPLWLWGTASIASVALVVVAFLGRDHGDGPTLRAMKADGSMSDAQARSIAENTVRVWIRERNAAHLANLEALTCSNDAAGTVVEELDSIRNNDTDRIPLNIAATGVFARHGSTWTLNTHLVNGISMEFVLAMQDGELRVCRIASAPIP